MGVTFHKVAPLVGTRTRGRLVGILGFPLLRMAVRSPLPISPCATRPAPLTWKQSVAPDIEIWKHPAAVRQGHDPQLERAATVAMEALTKNPAPAPAEPVYPNYAK